MKICKLRLTRLISITCYGLCLMALGVLLASCSAAQLSDQAQEAVDTYNSALEEYNAKTADYNEAAESAIAAVQEYQTAIDSAQAAINSGEEPYDQETLTTLEAAVTEAANDIEPAPEAMPSFEKLAVSDGMTKEELNALIDQANAGIEEMQSVSVPDTPEIPDYSESIEALEASQKAYEDSVQGLKQITAPTDEFVMERLQRIETITAIDAVTEDHDPNGQLNKQGGYIGCIYFSDSQVDPSEIYIEEGADSVIDIGNEGGGTVEIFPDVESAQARDEYIAGFDSAGAFSAGSHYVRGTLVVRTSDHLTATQQNELTEAITQALIAVE